MAESVRITSDNIKTKDYTPKPGVEYEVADGCIRTLLKPFNDVSIAYDEIMKDEDMSVVDPKKKGHYVNIRLAALDVITEGDPIPERVDMEVVGRAVADFFTFRMMTFGQLTNSSA